MNDQLKEFLSSKNAYQNSNPVLGKTQYIHSIIKVLNYLMVSLDNKNHSAALLSIYLRLLIS